MAHSTCVKCGGHTFEVRLFEPAGGRYKQNMVQCSSCGVPVGVLDFFNMGAQTDDIKAQLKALSGGISEIVGRLEKLERLMKQK